jgi:hypothetical protein
MDAQNSLLSIEPGHLDPWHRGRLRESTLQVSDGDEGLPKAGDEDRAEELMLILHL